MVGFSRFSREKGEVGRPLGLLEAWGSLDSLGKWKRRSSLFVGCAAFLMPILLFYQIALGERDMFQDFYS